MSTATLIPIQQFFDNNTNTFLSGGWVYAYAAGSSTPLNLYTDNTGNTPLPNPVQLNSFGQISSGIWGIGNYKIIVKSSDLSETIWTIDQIGSGVGSTASQLIGNLLITGNSITANSNNNVILQATSTGTYQLGGTASQGAQLQLFENTNNGTNSTIIRTVNTLTANRTLTLPDSNVDLTCVDTATPHTLQQVRTSSVTPVTLSAIFSPTTSALTYSSSNLIISQAITPIGAGSIVLNCNFTIWNPSGAQNMTFGVFLTNSGNAFYTVLQAPQSGAWMIVDIHALIPNTSYTAGTPLTVYISGSAVSSTAYVSGTTGNTLGGTIPITIDLTEWSS